MCIICIELIKQSMTVPEAERAGNEMVVTAKPEDDVEHYRKLIVISKDFIEEIKL